MNDTMVWLWMGLGISSIVMANAFWRWLERKK